MYHTQLAAVHEIDEAMHAEYTLRRRMLIERVKVTLQSFLYSERLRTNGTLDTARKLADTGCAAMMPHPSVQADEIFTLTHSASTPSTVKWQPCQNLAECSAVISQVPGW